MKRGQKNRKAGIFSHFFMTRKEVKSYSKEQPHLTKKDCSLCFNMGTVFLINQMGPLFRATFNLFSGHEKIPVLLFFCFLFIYVIKF
jgi:hypothetical protein